VPDRCVIDVDIRYLPGQDPAAIRDEIAGLADVELVSHFMRPPASVDRESPYVAALHSAVAPFHADAPMSVGRDGSSDAVSFLRVGVPAVEFGPIGAGHHGPEEWVSLSSLESYRQTLDSFLRSVDRIGS
jgi:succinyl-diaminopimelate desuccinylase